MNITYPTVVLKVSDPAASSRFVGSPAGRLGVVPFAVIGLAGAARSLAGEGAAVRSHLPGACGAGFPHSAIRVGELGSGTTKLYPADGRFEAGVPLATVVHRR
ncbi:hypothetical protein [Streptomyces tateyamensis]|nr:hypothetical protein [Streptomyces tateyamensis]